MKYFDIHTHPFKEYYEQPIETIQEWFDDNMKLMFIVGTNIETSKEVIETTKYFKNTYPIVGIHPNESNGMDDGIALEKIMTDEVIAIGEVGLDYHYDDTPSPEEQKISLREQIKVAQKRNIPVMLHIRDAMEDAIKLVTEEQYKNTDFIFHSFAGDAQDVEILLQYPNIYFSISGVVTFKNGKNTQEAVKNIPIDRIFTETDTPYLTPVPLRGKPNISPYVCHTTKFIAAIKNVSENTLLKQIQKNIEKVFKVYVD
ncbi:TatD family hydrolase [Mycoplasma phocoenae]|uniref:TatD family hydrolase n=1 Tax=Mycoplasma phocoenae TaxID=754517 RepID=A0A858U3Y0_9MOLU|nr:TatD family hydrolase [Mycoplasma phocoenae]QJG66721.1 TatD family hydrolase [Mycoplasma phocoenae]